MGSPSWWRRALGAPEDAARIRAAGPSFDADDIASIGSEIREALESGTLTEGRHVRELEIEFAAACGVPHAVAVNSGTAALEVIYRAIDVRGGEVVVPTNTFLSTANAVAFAGGRPVFADIDPGSLCVGVADVERALTTRTRCVVVVHIAGLVCPEMDRIVDLCRSRGVAVVEDAAHAHGARYRGVHAGALADAGAFSFYPTKPMTTGEGGMVTTASETVASFVRSFRAHGVDQRTRLHVAFGHNYRLPEIPAILGRWQLKRLERLLEGRRRVARTYDSALASLRDVRAIPAPAGQTHSYYKYVVVVPDVATRRLIAASLGAAGIATPELYWPPCHLQPYAQEAYGTRAGDLPKAEDVLARMLTLPMTATTPGDEAERVAAAFVAAARKAGLS